MTGYDIYVLAMEVLFIVGLIGIFKKFQISRIWAIVPIVRNYKLSQCADREEDGITWCIFDAVTMFFAYTMDDIVRYTQNFRQIYLTIWIIYVGIRIFNLVYSIKVFLGLCEVFGMKKRWALAWYYFKAFAALYWGFSKKIQPLYEEHEDENTNAAKESGINVESIEKGLSININSRKVHSGVKTKYLLKDIHFNIKPGRMVLLLGGSGAGKTTLLNAINGYEPADAQILLNGDDVYKHFDKMKYEIGFVPQQDLVRYRDTVYKTLSDAARLRLPTKIKEAEMAQKVDEVLNIFGLGTVKKSMVAKLSGGQKKRISIATEFISDPFLFILDEPDSGLDGIMARDLMNRLHEISRLGKIVIVITHTPDRVIDLFDDVIVLAKDANRVGRLVYYGEIDEAKKFFGKSTMEDIVRCINREDEGGEGKSDELIEKFAEVQHGK